MKLAAATLIEKNVVLVGAGNAHLVFLKKWGMRPSPGIAITLVSEASVIPYSAMVPAHLAGTYAREEITIDLVRLCQAVKVRFVASHVLGIDTLGRRVTLAARPPLAYDTLSLGIGSLPARPKNRSGDDFAIAMRPLGVLLRKVEAIDRQLQHTSRPFHLVVVGGGASGCELALAIQKRLGTHAGFRLTLLDGGPRLLPEFPIAAARAFENAFAAQEIAVRLNASVTGVTDGAIQIAGHESLAADAVILATQAAPASIVRESGLAVDEAGFLRVHETLQSVSDPAVFGTGDCVAFDRYPALPRNGVHAVREGAVLFRNVVSFLHDQPLQRFRPQRLCLVLLNTQDERAVFRYGPFVWQSRWARRLKDRIDRRWITKFTHFAPMGGSADTHGESPTMRCGGCGSKVSSDVLSAVLKRIDIPDDPRILMGTRAGEDAAVHRVRPELFGDDPRQLVEVQTVDYFKAFVDDPYRFGRIAALNSVSDLYAMNARPFSALAIATLPYARGPVQEAQLFELLSGAIDSFRELGIVLTGGHTTEGNDLALGFSVTGFAEEDRLFQKSRLRPGDLLVLTRPLGSGALLAAWMRGECRAEWFDPMMNAMLMPNRRPGEIFAAAGVSACTDVTGFGLAGHLLEMLEASRVSARLNADAVPLYAGFRTVVEQGIVSTLHRDNAKIACRVSGVEPLPAWLFDPQTSGGLLAGVRAERADATLEQLHRAGFDEAAVIGEVIPVPAGLAPTVHLT